MSDIQIEWALSRGQTPSKQLFLMIDIAEKRAAEIKRLKAELAMPCDHRYIGANKAAQMLPMDDMIETTTNPVAGVLITADWARPDLLELFLDYPPQLSGDNAAKAGYGLAVVTDKYTLFIKTIEPPAPLP